MTDYELVKNKDYASIFIKYRPLMMKFYMRMLTVSDCGFEDFEDFISEFYEDMVKAVNAVKLSKIKDPETFGLYCQLSFWLRNFTTRRIRDSFKLKKYSNPIPENHEEPCFDRAEDYSTIKQSFDEIATKYLDDTQRESVELFLRGVPAYKLPVGSRGWAKIIQIFKENMDI